MRNTRKIAAVILVLLISLILSSNVYADSTEYYANGNVKTIVLTGKGTIEYYENGNVKSIVVTGEGTANYKEDGTIESIVGTPSISLEQAKAEAQKLKKQPTTTTQTNNSTETMPETGFENYIYVVMGIAVIGIIFFALRYNALKKY